MLSKDELLRNINELYESYLRSERERVRLTNLNATLGGRVSQLEKMNAALEARKEQLRSLNAALREGFSKQGENLTALKAEISQRESDISRGRIMSARGRAFCARVKAECFYVARLCIMG